MSRLPEAMAVPPGNQAIVKAIAIGDGETREVGGDDTKGISSLYRAF